MNVSIKYMIAMLVASAALGMSQLSYAKFEVADDEDEFHQLLENNKYLIVHFNPYQEDSDADNNLDDTKKAFFAVAHKNRYARAGIMFVGANVPEITMHEDDLAQEFDEIGVDKETSTFILFRNGKPLLTDDGAVVKKVSNDMSEDEIEQFIERRWGKRIDRILESLERQEPAQPARTETVRYTTTYQPWYGNSGYYSAYPYNNWGYYGNINMWPGYGWRGGWGGGRGRIGGGWRGGGFRGGFRGGGRRR